MFLQACIIPSVQGGEGHVCRRKEAWQERQPLQRTYWNAFLLNFRFIVKVGDFFNINKVKHNA